MTTDQTAALYDAIDAFQRTHRLPGLQHAQIRGLLAEHLARALPAAVHVPPPADQTALREVAAQGIRDAACPGDCGNTEEECARERIQPFAWHYGRLAIVEGTPEQFADAVLAVLPEQTDRAAVLRWAADELGRMDYDTDNTDYGYDTYRDAWNGGVMDAAALLRRVAAEEQPAETQGTTADKAAALGLTDAEYRARSHAAAVATIRAAIPGMYAHVGFRLEDVLNEADAARPAVGEQPETQEAQHLGGRANAEDCPGCKAERRNLPYPFLCPGPDAP